MDSLLDVIPNMVLEDINKDQCVSIPSSNEIKRSVFSFEGNKAPGPDGFPFLFF